MKARNFALPAVFALSAMAAQAQTPPPPPEESMKHIHEMMAQGMLADRSPDAGAFTYEFVSADFGSGRTVKGAPYSAQAVTENTQAMADGNRIVHKNTATLYRDSEGRTRREETLGSIGPWSSDREPERHVMIFDPVSNTHYVLDEKAKVAHKTALPPLSNRFGKAPEGGTIVVGGTMATVEAAEGSGNHFFTASVAGPDAVRRDSKIEQLGKQTIEGVVAEGTRTTTTIPAGAIGNERAIEIVSERWYSSELQTNIMTKRSDPRMGDTVYRLTNISRTEPLSSLFEPPADYTVKEGLHEMKVRMEHMNVK